MVQWDSMRRAKVMLHARSYRSLMSCRPGRRRSGSSRRPLPSSSARKRQSDHQMPTCMMFGIQAGPSRTKVTSPDSLLPRAASKPRRKSLDGHEHDGRQAHHRQEPQPASLPCTRILPADTERLPRLCRSLHPDASKAAVDLLVDILLLHAQVVRVIPRDAGSAGTRAGRLDLAEVDPWARRGCW